MSKLAELKRQLEIAEKAVGSKLITKNPMMKKVAEKKVAALKDKIKEEESKESKSKTKPVKKVVAPKKVEKVVSKKAKEAKPKKEVKVSAATKKEMKRHKQGRSKSDLARDAKRSALKGGKRISAEGNVYYENRPNRSDVNPRTRFEKGGSVEGDKYIVVNEKMLAVTMPNRFNNTKGTDEAEVLAVKPSEIGFTKIGDVFFLKGKKVRPATSEDFDAYKVVEPKGSKSDYKIVTGFDHKNNHELYHVVGIDNDYVGEYHKDKKDAEAELKDLNGSKFEEGGNIGKINWQNFTLNELQDYIKDNYSSDIQLHTFSPLKEVRTNNGTELKQDDFISIGKISKKDKDSALSIGHGKQVEVTSGSENIYLNIVVYDKSDKPLMLSIYTKEDKKGIKKLSSEIIEKFAKGGTVVNLKDTKGEVEFVKLGKTKNGYGLGGSSEGYVAMKDKKVLFLVGEDKPYSPLGGKEALQEIIDTTEEGKTYEWKSPVNKLEEGGNIEEEDLFENYDELPVEVQDVLSSYQDEEGDYSDLEEMQEELKPLGYTFDYGLDAVPYNLRKIEKMAKGGSIAACPIGTKIQTIIFSKEFYNKVRAVKWLDKNNFKGTIADDKSTTVRFRQASPDKFKEDTFKTIELTKGVKAVIGCPKK